MECICTLERVCDVRKTAYINGTHLLRYPSKLAKGIKLGKDPTKHYGNSHMASILHGNEHH